MGKDNSEALDYLGFDYGSSNRINLNTKIEDLKLANPLATQEFEFTINGVNFSFSGNNTLNGIINNINSSGAGVSLTYSAITDTFTLNSKETGAASNITFNDTEGNF